MQMEHAMKVNGWRINKRAMELRYGPTDLLMRVFIQMGKKKEMEE